MARRGVRISRLAYELESNADFFVGEQEFDALATFLSGNFKVPYLEYHGEDIPDLDALSQVSDNLQKYWKERGKRHNAI